MINITLPDGTVKEFEKGISGYEIARNISEGLARNAISIVKNGETIELTRPINEDAKIKISAEYFPTKTKKAKLRRSTAQKIIKHFFMLGVEPHITAEVMLYNSTVAQKYSSKKEMYYSSFYKSILNAFEQCLTFCISNGILPHFKSQILEIVEEVQKQKWPNKSEFKNATAIIEASEW